MAFKLLINTFNRIKHIILLLVCKQPWKLQLDEAIFRFFPVDQHGVSHFQHVCFMRLTELTHKNTRT